MKIRLIQTLDAFDPVYWRGKSPSTVVSLSLDGRRYYSLKLSGIRTISSGKQVAVAFQDEEESRPIAWIDPVSQEFHTTYASNDALAFLMALLIPVILWAMLSSFGVPQPMPAAAAGGIFVLIAFMAIKESNFRRNLETSLRSQ